jgi:hypothetical protein
MTNFMTNLKHTCLCVKNCTFVMQNLKKFILYIALHFRLEESLWPEDGTEGPKHVVINGLKNKCYA